MNHRLITNSVVLVTGGAGFIGSNLCEALLGQQNEVVCLDNFSTGSHQNIAGLLAHRNFKFIEGDIRNPADCRRAADGVTYVLHQAALGSVPRSVNDPLTTNEVNISGFLNMLIAARDAGVKRFVYAASSSTYGDHAGLPKVEEKIGKPLSPYAVTKYVNELYAGVFSDLFEITTVGLRYFNVFGRRQHPAGAYAAVIPRFIALLMQHQAPLIHGDGTQSRDFTYIDNVIQANQLAALAEEREAVNTVYNIAYGESTTLNELYEKLVRLLGSYDAQISEIPAQYGATRTADVRHSLASIDKAKRMLGYHPTHSLEQGLEEAIDWYWHHLRHKV